MGEISEMAKEKAQGAGHAPTHSLYIGGENETDRLINTTITHEASGGGSGATFSVAGNFEEYEDANLSLHLGYGGKMLKYFVGNVISPNYDKRTDTTEFDAFGPFKLMKDQILDSDQNFLGWTLERVIMYLARLCRYGPGQVEVINGAKFTVPAGEFFPFHNNCNDVANTLMSKANFVGADIRGGKRLFMPKPRPGSNGAYQDRLHMGDYYSFDTTNNYDTRYSKVIVYRDTQPPETPIKAVQELDRTGRFKPPLRRAYLVSDFPGNQDKARQEAARIARTILRGQKSGDLEMPMNPEIQLWDGFLITERDMSKKYKYSFGVDDTIQLNYGADTLPTTRLSGSVLLVTEEDIEEAPFRFESETDHGVVY